MYIGRYAEELNWYECEFGEGRERENVSLIEIVSWFHYMHMKMRLVFSSSWFSPRYNEIDIWLSCLYSYMERTISLCSL